MVAGTSVIRRRPFCPGCGLHYAVYDDHRDDCTAGDWTQVALILRPRTERRTPA